MPNAKTADSLLDAAKKFGKGIVDTVAEGSEEFQQAAGKFAADHDMSTISDTVKKKSEPIPTGMTFGFSTSAFRADSDAKRRNHSCVSGTPARHSGQL